MRVALTIWENRISPLFDAARELLVVHVGENGMIERRHEPMDPQRPLRLAQHLMSRRVTTLICGAISETPAQIIEAAGITLVAFVAGSVGDVLEALSTGKPLLPVFSMPGCGCPKCPRPRGMKKTKKMMVVPTGARLPIRNRAGKGGESVNPMARNKGIGNGNERVKEES